MSANQVVGAVIFVVGAMLLVFGFNATEAPIDQISNALTGRYTDRTMWYLILGAAGVVGGALVAFARPR